MKLNYLRAATADYVDELYQQYLNDPASVDESWQYFFDGLELGSETGPAYRSGAVANGNGNGSGNGHAGAATNGHGATAEPISLTPFDLAAEAKVAELISAYRARGWLLADVDPLNPPPARHALLDLSHFSLKESDLSQTFVAGKLLDLGPTSLKNIIDHLRRIYCGTVGVEYTHIQDKESRDWVREKMEKVFIKRQYAPEDKKWIFRRLAESKGFEHFLHTRYVAQKRFSIEGAESLIPALDRMIDKAAELSANNIVMGMAHRGRLNVLHNTFGKLADHIFSEFEDEYEKDPSLGQGDVKYHKGFSADRTTAHGPVHLSLAHNPSHLEFVYPVVEGIARAKQRDLDDKSRSQVVPIIIHGDAAVAGQGVVYETLNFSQTQGYTTGGSLHVVIDNQVGFTTSPPDARSTKYSTDVAKMVEIPIFHVNGDDPETLCKVAELAMEFRQKFKRDIFINLICYRLFGHNEGDEPSFTQPLMYQKIKSHASPLEIYAKKLVAEGVYSTEDVKKINDEIVAKYTEAQERTRSQKPKPFTSSFTNKWKGLRKASPEDIFKPVETAVTEETLHDLSKKLNTMPGDFHLHKKLARFFEARAKAVETGAGIDWGNAEILAYASLLKEGHTIRLSGQDVERGTFTHRHAVLSDVEVGTKYCPLRHLDSKQGEFIVFNSTLSETAVLGFEYGWSLADPSVLVIWEAQFGDFANGAQVIIDQFISSCESKWQRSTGIVLLLPHGYEGQGPEHSSARLERFLQLCGEYNMTICNLTTPAQIFHVLRRQIKRDFRKPLVIMSPKSLLRHPKAVSTLQDLSQNRFQEVLDDPFFHDSKTAQQVGRVILCSGKIYYDLLTQREASQKDKTAIVRVEQLYPWPGEALLKTLGRYSPNAEIVWVQEEPRNMGGWSYVFSQWAGGYDHFAAKVQNRAIKYIGREIAAAPAVGSHKLHVIEQNRIVLAAIT